MISAIKSLNFCHLTKPTRKGIILHGKKDMDSRRQIREYIAEENLDIGLACRKPLEKTSHRKTWLKLKGAFNLGGHG
jgi:hypothetical protein